LNTSFQKNNNLKKLTFIDLFAGAGGLSEGFIRAGFKPIAHVEMDKDSCFTLKTRIAYHYLKDYNKLDKYLQYLKEEITRDELYNLIPKELLNTVINEEISDITIKNIFKKIRNELKRINRENVDVIIGGPPCQVYSTVGRSRIGKDNVKNDDRYFLYKHYGKFLKEFEPKFFVFENVPGILSADNKKLFKEIENYFLKCGYKIKGKVLDSSKYGVLQKRKRFIAFGYPKDEEFEYPKFEEVNYNAKVNNLFNDLPALNAGEILKRTPYLSEPSEYLLKTEIRNGLDFVTQHITRPHNEHDLKIYRKAIEKWNEEKIRLKYTDLPDKDRTHNNISSFLDRFKVVNGEGTYSHTLVAHIAKDGHYYIHPDKKQLRSISVREAARIQSFPDDYYFEGSRTSAFKQIGNAVPPLISKMIANNIKHFL